VNRGSIEEFEKGYVLLLELLAYKVRKGQATCRPNFPYPHQDGLTPKHSTGYIKLAI
jgi:hypothetical protein